MISLVRKVRPFSIGLDPLATLMYNLKNKSRCKKNLKKNGSICGSIIGVECVYHHIFWASHLLLVMQRKWTHSFALNLQ